MPPFSSSNNSNDIFTRDNKWEEIKNKLCLKRKSLEEQAHDQTKTATEREDFALELMRLKESMTTFGITEIDYQVYLAQQNKNSTS